MIRDRHPRGRRIFFIKKWSGITGEKFDMLNRLRNYPRMHPEIVGFR